MAGNSGKRDADVDGSRDVPSEEPRTDSSPVLDDVSDAELDAIVGKLRTDKSRTMAPATQARTRSEQMSERLHRGRPRVSVPPPPPQQVPSGAPQPVATDAAPRGGRPVGGGIFERTAAGYDSPEPVDSSTLVTEKVAVGDASPTPGSSAPSASEAVAGNASPKPGNSAPSAPELAVSGNASLTPGNSAPSAPGLAVVGNASPTTGSSADSAPASGSGAAPVAEPGGVDGAAAQAPQSDVGTASSAPAGTHAVLAESRTGPKRSRWRGAVWLTAAGGVVGVVTVAVAMGLLGFDGRALATRLGLREDVPSAPPAPATAAVAPSAEPVNAGGATPPSTGSTSAADVASTAPVTPPAPAGAGVASTAAASPATPTSGSSAGTSSLGAVGIDRGGSLPALSVSRGGTSGGTDRASAWPADSELDTDSAPSPAPFSRPSVAAAALERRPDATPADKAVKPSTPPVPASTEPKSDVGPDEDYEKELLEPPAGLGGPPDRTVYVPPDPSKPREILPQSDIFEVVAANKDDITACAAEENPSRVGTGGRVVVRWTILPSGLVQDVVTETPSLRGTPLARCIESKVRRWTFPRHQEQSGPVRFPFVF